MSRLYLIFRIASHFPAAEVSSQFSLFDFVELIRSPKIYSNVHFSPSPNKWFLPTHQWDSEASCVHLRSLLSSLEYFPFHFPWSFFILFPQYLFLRLFYLAHRLT